MIGFPRFAAVTGAGLLLLLAWDASGLDLWLARAMSTPTGFPARDHWFLTRVLHEGARALAGLLLLVLAISACWPRGCVAGLSRRRRLWLLAAVVSAMLVVSALKRLSATSCPWDLQGLGGDHAWVSHWRWFESDGGPGHCFPAGHASAAFAWIAGYFAWPRDNPVARRWLAGALVAGMVLGVGQQLRGAHFMSHTLWTAWICWTWTGLLALGARIRETHAAAAD